MKIVVLAGGLSPEREVSFSSGTMATNALLSLGHRAILVDLFFGLPDWDGTTDLFAEAKPLLPYRVSETEPDLDALRLSRKTGFNDYIGLNVPELCAQADVVYMALHGDCGENGRLQAFFDTTPKNGDLFFLMFAHGYEFDFETKESNWQKFEAICRMVSGRDDVICCSIGDAFRMHRGEEPLFF